MRVKTIIESLRVINEKLGGTVEPNEDIKSLVSEIAENFSTLDDKTKELAWATYGTTTSSDITTMLNAGKVVYVLYEGEFYILTTKATTLSPYHVFTSCSSGSEIHILTLNTTNNTWAHTSSHAGAVASNQGIENAGKFLTVGSDGIVVPITMEAWQGGSY